LLTSDDRRARRRDQRNTGLIDHGLDSVKQVVSHHPKYWESLREFARANRILLPDDEKALVPALRMPSMIPTDRQAARLLHLADQAAEAGWRFE
jgi:hypothetical protein